MKATLVELTIYNNVYPLASGYMEACARADDALRNEYSFHKYSAQVMTDPGRVLSDLLASDADVYGFSCYVWNAGLVRFLVEALREAKPNAHFILGGPQVINQGESLIAAADERTTICNGEAEITFPAYLRQLLQTRPELSEVAGLSFRRDGELVTTEAQARLRELDRIPSPFLGGVFEKGRYNYAVYETNRGCPYHCGFCFWGGGPGTKLGRFSDDRVYEELTWLAKNNVVGMNLADANWGILPRDVDFSRHIAALKKKYYAPYMIVTNTAKNKPERMAEISKIFKDAGIVSPHTISVQSMSSEVLAASNRKNMPVEKYKEMQARLYDQKIGNYVELIWPLPAETSESFKAGITELCRSRTECIFVYSHVLLKNTEFYERADALGFQTERAPVAFSDVDIITATKDVDRAAFEDGLWFNFALTCLYNARGLYVTATHLDATGVASFAEVFDAFVRYCRDNADAHPVIGFQRAAMEDLSYYNFTHSGMLLHLLLHEHRRAFDRLLAGFACAQPWWSDPLVRALFEVDLVNKPLVYANTAVQVPDYAFDALAVAQDNPKILSVTIPERVHPLLGKLVEGSRLPPHQAKARVNYARKQLPFMKGKTLEENASYVNGVMLDMSDLLPIWGSAVVAQAPRPARKLPLLT